MTNAFLISCEEDRALFLTQVGAHIYQCTKEEYTTVGR